MARSVPCQIILYRGDNDRTPIDETKVFDTLNEGYKYLRSQNCCFRKQKMFPMKDKFLMVRSKEGRLFEVQELADA